MKSFFNHSSFVRRKLRPAEATLIITLHSASTQRQVGGVKITLGSILTWADWTEYGV